MLISATQPVVAWPGHNWDEWRQVTTWAKSDLKTDQAGRTDLATLLGAGDARIDGIKAWEAKRADYTSVIRAILGSPGDLKPPKPQAEVLGEEVLDDHVRRHIRIRCEKDDWIPAYLLLPKHRLETGATEPAGGTQTARAARLPVMICLHQTVAQGKDEPCGIKGDPQLAFALQLVRRGYVCVAPDVIGFGERIPPGGQPYANSIDFYKRHPGWSFMGKMVWDVSRIVDWLETCEFADPLQIGCIGHSHGAYGTLFAAAFEPRIAAAVASCGFTTFRSDPVPNRWSHLTALIPQLGTYLPDVAQIPFDWQHICAMIAPRPLYVWYATKDTIFPNTTNLDAMFTDVRGVYGLYGAADDLAWRAYDGPHRFPDDGRAAAYVWLGERLFPVGDLRGVPDSPGAWQTRRDAIRRVIRRTIGSPSTQLVSADVRVLATEPLPKYERRLIEYRVAPDDRVKAYLCIPPLDQGSRPGVLVLHQTTAEGKRESVGLAGDKSLAFAADLAERGYVTLSPDSITAGERIDRFKAFDTRGHYLAHPHISAMGRMLWDAQRALDVLLATEGVEPHRIACIGHSLGAEESLMLAAFDERIRACVASCGYATFAADGNRARWARDAWFSYMPKLRPIFTTGRLPHWDWDDVVRLVAPRGLCLHNTTDDQIFPESESAYVTGEAARGAWRLFDAPADAFVNVLRPGGHAVSDESRAEIYAWLETQLQRGR